MNSGKSLVRLSGDASFRKFYRFNNKKKSILVFAEKQKKIIYLYTMQLINY